MKGVININYFYYYPLYYRREEPNTILKDYGPKPLIVDMESVTKQNENYRLALWTGKDLQLTLMKIDVGEDIGLEVHHDVDQFIRIEEGDGVVRMGKTKDANSIVQPVSSDYAIFVPAGTWHNLVNTGNKPIKLYTIYAPIEHPHGTIEKMNPGFNRCYPLY